MSRNAARQGLVGRVSARTTTLVTLVLLALPRLALACATCASSGYGDRTYNVAYLGLILTPFALLAVVGTVLRRAWLAGRRRAARDDAIDTLTNEGRAAAPEETR